MNDDHIIFDPYYRESVPEPSSDSPSLIVIHHQNCLKGAAAAILSKPDWRGTFHIEILLEPYVVVAEYRTEIPQSHQKPYCFSRFIASVADIADRIQNILVLIESSFLQR